MKKEDAEEFTQSLGQIVGGSWRQIALAKRLGVPQALGLKVDEWVNKRLGGYVKLAVDDRRQAVVELAAEGESTRGIAATLGTSQSTVVRDLEPNGSFDAEEEPEIEPNGSLDAVAALAATDKVRKTADKAAARQAKEEQRTAEVLELARTAPSGADAYRIYNLDCNEATFPERVDWVITDPPYERGAIDCYAALARVAEKSLKPGGSLLCMTGQSYLPEVMVALSEYLTYHWTLAYLTPGGQAVQLFQRNVNTFWKPVLWFTSGAYSGSWIGDVTRSAVNDNDKRFHEWGQSESGMLDLMTRFVRPGDLVLDPFMGAGTTGLAALALKTRFIGYDKDEASFAEAKMRLAVAAQESEAA